MIDNIIEIIFVSGLMLSAFAIGQMVTKDELRKKKVIHGKHGTYTFIPKDDIQ
jgi:hypothetical protein